MKMKHLRKKKLQIQFQSSLLLFQTNRHTANIHSGPQDLFKFAEIKETPPA